MKPETLIYDKVRRIIPDQSEATIFFAGITETSYEIFFYSLIEGKFVQCYILAEQGKIDEIEMEAVFEKIVKIIRESKQFNAEKYNLATIKVDKSGITLEIQYHERNVRIYKIKKEWEQINL